MSTHQIASEARDSAEQTPSYLDDLLVTLDQPQLPKAARTLVEQEANFFFSDEKIYHGPEQRSPGRRLSEKDVKKYANITNSRRRSSINTIVPPAQPDIHAGSEIVPDHPVHDRHTTNRESGHATRPSPAFAPVHTGK